MLFNIGGRDHRHVSYSFFNDLYARFAHKRKNCYKNLWLYCCSQMQNVTSDIRTPSWPQTYSTLLWHNWAVVNFVVLKRRDHFVSFAQKEMELNYMILLDSASSTWITETGRSYKTALCDLARISQRVTKATWRTLPLKRFANIVEREGFSVISLLSQQKRIVLGDFVSSFCLQLYILLWPGTRIWGKSSSKCSLQNIFQREESLISYIFEVFIYVLHPPE